jgi:hypothetical protein
VATNGSDGAACTSTAPCQTLGRAYTVAQSGKVIEVRAGTYPGQTVPSGTKAVTFRGVPGAKVRTLDNHAANVTFDGIEVDAAFAQTAALENHGASGVTFKNAHVGNVTDDKAALISGSDFTFDNVVFHDAVFQTPGTHMECVYAIVVPGFTVRNSLFRDCAIMDLFFTYGDWWSPRPPAYGNVTIENNVFAHSEREANGGWHYYGLLVGNTGYESSRLDGWVVRNNTFENAVGYELDGASNTRWVNNIGGWTCTAGITYSHNVGSKCGATDKAVSPASSTATTTAPFGWVNPAAYDFRLTAGSPAVGAGDPNDAPARDRDGNVRTGTPDAGAYEL